MAAEYRDKPALITTVRGQYLSFATFLTTLLSHYPLPFKGIQATGKPSALKREHPADQHFKN